MFVKPGINPETGEPFRVRIPHTFALLPEAGGEVADDFFWRWMLRHGDVVEAVPEAEPEAKPDVEAVPAVAQPKAEG